MRRSRRHAPSTAHHVPGGHWPWRMLALPCLLATATACTDGASGRDQAEVEPNEWLPGGATTNTVLLGVNAFTTPVANVTADHEGSFFSGNSFFNQSWVQAPSSTESRDGLGPLFNARSCAACHFKDGRGRPPLTDGEPFLGILLRLSIPGTTGGAPIPEPAYGEQLQPSAILGVPAEGTPRVQYREIPGSYPDGETYTLLEPTYAIEDLAYGALDPNTLLSPRVAPAVIGLGLLEAIPQARLETLADPNDADGNGISGRINRVRDVTSGATVVGRFGWKAEQPTVRQQSAGAFVGDIGVTSSLFPRQDCTSTETACLQALNGGDPEIADTLLNRVELYGRLLAVPVRERWQDREVLRGKKLFGDVGCASCHVPRHETGTVDDLPELSRQVIWPYTDLLLHDLGEGLSDHRPSFEADGREWRTPPLWGLRLFRVVNDHDRLLHDGRARGVAEAILWHGGEAEAAREAFRRLPAQDRTALITFVESL